MARPNRDNLTKVFVGSLPANAKASDLRDLFSKFGPIIECDIANRCGFLHLEDKDLALKAIDELNNSMFMGSRISVEKGRVRASRGGGGGGGGGNRSSRGGGAGGPGGGGGRMGARRGRDAGDRKPYARNDFAREIRDPGMRNGGYAGDRGDYYGRAGPLPFADYGRDPFNDVYERRAPALYDDRRALSSFERDLAFGPPSSMSHERDSLYLRYSEREGRALPPVERSLFDDKRGDDLGPPPSSSSIFSRRGDLPKSSAEYGRQSPTRYASYISERGAAAYGHSPGPYGDSRSLPPAGSSRAYASDAYPSERSLYASERSVYPPERGAYPSERGAYPPERSPYPPERSAYASERGAYPPERGAYPSERSAFPSERSAYPPERSAYLTERSAYPPERNVYPSERSAYASERNTYPVERGSAYPPERGAYSSERSSGATVAPSPTGSSSAQLPPSTTGSYNNYSSGAGAAGPTAGYGAQSSANYPSGGNAPSGTGYPEAAYDRNGAYESNYSAIPSETAPARGFTGGSAPPSARRY